MKPLTLDAGSHSYQKRKELSRRRTKTSKNLKVPKGAWGKRMETTCRAGWMKGTEKTENEYK